jgi:hypothetical protein
VSTAPAPAVQDPAIRFASRVFFLAGVYGLLALAPLYFMEARIGRDHPPPITHSEYYYGFVGVGLAWQIAFLILSRDPLRHRPLMLPAVVEKMTFAVAAIWLWTGGRVAAAVLGFSIVDLVLGVLFAAAWVRTGRVAVRG